MLGSALLLIVAGDSLSLSVAIVATRSMGKGNEAYAK